jgi:hypothetical protein
MDSIGISVLELSMTSHPYTLVRYNIATTAVAHGGINGNSHLFTPLPPSILYLRGLT